MPIYEYRCEKGHTFEVMQRMTRRSGRPLRGLRRAGRSGSSTRSPCTSRARASTTPTTAPASARAREGAAEAGRQGDSRSQESSSSDSESKLESARTPSPQLHRAVRARGSTTERPPSAELPTTRGLSRSCSFAPPGASAPGRRQRVLAVGQRRRPVGLSTWAGAEPPISAAANRRQQRQAAHVGAEHLGRVPRRPRQAEERARREQLGLDRVEDLLLVAARG